jgi:hypothetical protein
VLLVCTRMLLVCTRVLLVCTCVLLVCYSYVLVWCFSHDREPRRHFPRSFFARKVTRYFQEKQLAAGKLLNPSYFPSKE